MTQHPERLQTALKAHQQGDLAQAKSLYETILKNEPDNADAMHLLGILAAQLGQFETAIAWFQQAIAHKNTDPVFHNNLGNALKSVGRWSEAIASYKTALKLAPNYAEAHNNLGSVYHKQNNLAAALTHYVKATHLQPDYLEAHINLGFLFLKEGNTAAAIKQFNNVLQLHPESAIAHWHLANLYLTEDKLEQAIFHYKKLLALQPQHAEALSNLGVVYLKQHNFADAINYFQKALAVEPQHKEARSNLAAILLQQDRPTEAAWHYQLYLQLNPEDAEAHYNFAVANMTLGNIQEAVSSLEKTLELMPTHADAHCNLAAIFLKAGKKPAAITHYQQALTLQPNNPAISYLLDALTGTQQKAGEPPALQHTAAPIEYIKNLFDNYAGHFDKQLTESLQYQLPDLLQQAIEKYLPQPTEKLAVLDLGCGTGLSGLPLRKLAKHLVGVDISPRMLEQAREKNIYDELIEADILQMLQTSTAQFDLIIAADTLVYFGDLAAIFAGCQQRLKDHGLLAFSTEQGQKNDYELQTTGRYLHNPNYIKTLAQQYNFNVLHCEEVTGRYQEGNPVASVIYILQKFYGNSEHSSGIK